MSATPKKFLLSLLLILFLISSSSTNADINVADFGAKGDGKTDASKAFLAAWNTTCSSSEPTTMYVPGKKYFLNPFSFKGPCKNSKMTVRIDGILIAPDYIKIGSDENWLMIDQVEGLTVIGGYLDGRGSSLWACKGAGGKCLAGATSLAIFSSSNVVVQNITSLNAELGHINIHTCQNITVQGVIIHASETSPNTDGIHVQDSFNVRVLNTRIKTGDDCISIGPGTRNLLIQNVACGPGHGISIGSLGKDGEEEGVQNVVVQNVTFTGTQNGLRIKTWARPSNGFVKGVVFKQVVMNNVQNPIVIDQNYCPRNENCPNQNSGVEISQVTYSNIKGTSATQVAVKFDCSPTSPCKGISLQDIKLTYPGGLEQSSCQNALGTTRGQVSPAGCL